MKDILIDDGANAELNKYGFIKVPFISDQELNKLRNIYFDLNPKGPEWYMDEGIHMTSWCKDLDYKLAVSKSLSQLFEAKVNEFLDEVRCINQVFIAKQPGAHTTFKVHQDWSVVDETCYRSVNIWVPLHDVDATTGALWVVPGSHTLDRQIRGSGYLFPDYSQFYTELEDMAQSIPVKAGEALIFFHNVIHGSPPNLGNRDRVVACFTAIPKEAPLHIYFQSASDAALEVHHPDDDFMYKYQNLREDSILNPPTKSPAELLDPQVKKKVEKNEIEKLANTSINLRKSIHDHI